MRLSRIGLDWMILACVNLTVPAYLAWKHYSGEAPARVVIISGIVTIVLVNFVSILGIRTRNKRQGTVMPRILIVGSIGMAILGAAGTVFSAYQVPEQNEYLRLALSDTPLDEIHPAQKALVVEFTRKELANSAEEARALKDTKPISPPLFSTASFADVSVIRSVSEAYKEANELDFTYSNQQELATSEFRAKMRTVDPEFLKSFDLAEQAHENATTSTVALQHECLAATLDLYDYAAAHIKAISVKDDEFAFSNETVHKVFTAKLENSKELYDKLQAGVQEQVRLREHAGKSAGTIPD